jgi:peptidoglycan/xylan/chitin deacetylase (PgdA/CDA1 family)
MFYPVKTPFWLRWAYPQAIWRMDPSSNAVYLTFDDGPHPTITPWVLDQLDRYDAKATFFCIGNNVEKYGDTYREVIQRGHAVGNHTFDHCNGWNTPRQEYLSNIEKAERHIKARFFRPPYGRMTWQQASGLRKGFPQLKLVMWDVLSGDFDPSISGARCAQNVLQHVQAGSVVVFHDSEKAFPRLTEALPVVLEHLNKKKYKCESLHATIY